MGAWLARDDGLIGNTDLEAARVIMPPLSPLDPKTMTYSVSPIGFVRSCFKEKFAIPRQPQLAPAARGVLELVAPFDQGDAVQGLEQVSHVWLLFLFHQALEEKPRLKVRPPRLGGNKSMGVFATRATHRPNGIGQSVVKLDKVEANRLWISGIDLLDGTPILDIKPYVPYADIIDTASNSIASAPPSLIPVQWTDSALQQAHSHAQRLNEPLVELIEQCLAQDPRPAYQIPTPEREYGAQFWDVDVRWHYPTPDLIRVLEVIPVSNPA
ncbi:tRNA-Thr(GGU) m(6)t(6)A37 methyltransferase TsaA [Pseudomonas sp. F-14 TE3482]